MSTTDGGPFPLYHRDFFHSNVVVDERYTILGVIDWDGACVLPWELAEFPLFPETVPRPTDAPWNYDADGLPRDEDTRQRWSEREGYVGMVARWEEQEAADDRLSSALRDVNGQYLAAAMRLYLTGKLSLYDGVLDLLQDEGRGARTQESIDV